MDYREEMSIRYTRRNYIRLQEAVRALYYAGVWTCDRPVDEAALWTAVRDAAGFEPGSSPKPKCNCRWVIIHTGDNSKPRAKYRSWICDECMKEGKR